MKAASVRNTVVLSLIALSSLLAGCASVAVTEDAIEKNTAFALGLEKGTFKISNREDSGIKTTYLVTTNAGKKYSCYVTGSLSVVGRAVSDAMCNEIGKTRQSAGASTASSSCNALLKAAGKCS